MGGNPIELSLEFPVKLHALSQQLVHIVDLGGQQHEQLRSHLHKQRARPHGVHAPLQPHSRKAGRQLFVCMCVDLCSTLDAYRCGLCEKADLPLGGIEGVDGLRQRHGVGPDVDGGQGGRRALGLQLAHHPHPLQRPELLAGGAPWIETGSPPFQATECQMAKAKEQQLL